MTTHIEAFVPALLDDKIMFYVIKKIPLQCFG